MGPDERCPFCEAPDTSRCDMRSVDDTCPWEEAGQDDDDETDSEES